VPAIAVPRIILRPRLTVEDLAGPDAELLDRDRSQAVALSVRPGSAGDGIVLDEAASEVGERYGVDFRELTQRLRSRGGAGEASVVTLPRVLPGMPDPPWAGLPERVVLLGVGDGRPGDLRRAGAALARAVEGLDQVVAPASEDWGEEAARAFVEGFLLAAYRPPRAGRTDPPTPPAETLVLLGGPAPSVVEAAVRSASATWTARRLAATPSNLKSPAWFAAEAQHLAEEVPGVTVTVREADWLADQGFGGVLAVASGSAYEPRLVVVDYQPDGEGPQGEPLWPPSPGNEGAGTGHVVIVGKGITFDTGGLSVKPAEAMTAMKTDMSGAAAALAAVLGAAEARVARRVTAVLPLAENALGGSAYRPGDVLRLFDGSTVEVLNTDAEGRLILADALAWARTVLRPAILVDIATLTGAASLGLGRRHAALYATDETLAEALAKAGEGTGEAAWRMPLVAEYEPSLDSSVADVVNVTADPHVKGGSIVAALFLRRFVGDLPWAHLDIAGPARAQKAEHEVSEGATGFGARLLLRWLEDGAGPGGPISA
jgi:leucyl aminopeptidase